MCSIIGPFYYKNNEGIEEKWYKNGEYHREDGPAIIVRNNEGIINSESWYKDGKYHREDGPSIIYRNNNGIINTEYWYKNGIAHREDGPAIIYRNIQGIISETWYKYGELNREDGPAVIERNNKGEIIKKEWYIKDEKYTYDKFINYISSLRTELVSIMEKKM